MVSLPDHCNFPCGRGWVVKTADDQHDRINVKETKCDNNAAGLRAEIYNKIIYGPRADCSEHESQYLSICFFIMKKSTFSNVERCQGEVGGGSYIKFDYYIFNFANNNYYIKMYEVLIFTAKFAAEF